jgi:hypothetical protein
MNSSKPIKKLTLSFEPAFQIIYLSITSICFCLALVFATTIQTVNWYTIVFLFLGIILAYFKRGTHVKITDSGIDCTYFRGMKERRFKWEEIQGIDSYYPSRRIIIKTYDNEEYIIYLNQTNQRKLLELLKQNKWPINVTNKETE